MPNSNESSQATHEVKSSQPSLTRSQKELLAQAKLEKLKREARKDPVVFISHFCYTFNPKVAPYHLPFKLFDFQINLVREMQHAIDTGEDLFVEKSREMGVSYTTTALFLWYWLYVPGSNFLVGSRKEDYVDNTRGTSEILTNKEESLFGKLEYMLMRLPHDLRPKGFEFKNHSNYMSLINPELGNIISGLS